MKETTTSATPTSHHEYRRTKTDIDVSGVNTPAERTLTRAGQRADHEVVGILDQVHDRLIGEGAVDDHRVPVALVQVVARDDGGMRLAELLRQSGLAFEADAQRLCGEAREGEDLAAHLEHRVLGTERE